MKKSRMLLVDDDEVYLFVTKTILNQITNDIEVTSFTDGEQAIGYVHLCVEQGFELPQVILLDINMPFMDGWGFLTEFKKLNPELKDTTHIFLVTSSEAPDDIAKAHEFEELSGYVVKPVVQEKLSEIIAEVFM